MSFPAGQTPSFMNFNLPFFWLYEPRIDDEVLLSARPSCFHRSFVLRRQGFFKLQVNSFWDFELNGMGLLQHIVQEELQGRQYVSACANTFASNATP